MFSGFFDNVGGGAGGLPGRRGPDASSAATTAPARPPALVSFWAGRMTLTANTENAKYKCEPDTRRGEARLVYKASSSAPGLYWEWYDRRDDSLVDSKLITTQSQATFERVTLPSTKVHARDRVYVLTSMTTTAEPSGEQGENTDPNNTETVPTYDMYWMQDISEEKDDEIMVQVNQYLADPASAAPAGGSATDTTAGGATNNAAAGTSSATTFSSTQATPTTAASQSQVDALSNILQNLGMPQGETTGTDLGGGTAGGGGRLTLADLQGAMAGLPTTAGGSSTGTRPVPLSEVVTPGAITTLLESDETVRNRLMELLPEEQRSAEYLEENLRSPQVQATLRALTQALLPDSDTGNMDSFYSILANFNLDAADGNTAMAQNNPIQAFLDCLLAQVQRESSAGGEETMEDDTPQPPQGGGEEKEE